MKGLQELLIDEIKQPVTQLHNVTNDAWSRAFIPYVAFDKDRIKANIIKANKILTKLGF